MLLLSAQSLWSQETTLHFQPRYKYLSSEKVLLPVWEIAQRSPAVFNYHTPRKLSPLSITAALILTDLGPIVVDPYKDPMSVKSSRINGLETCFSPVGISCSFFW